MRVITICSVLVTWIFAATPVFQPVQTNLLSDGETFVNAWADYDVDGDLDLFVGFDNAPNRLYRNDNGVLVNAAEAAGLADARPTRASAWGDFDADGDPDLLLGFTPGAGAGSLLRLYRNDGGRFTNVTQEILNFRPENGAVRQTAWIDFDADGDLDLFVAFRDRPNAMLRNEAGRFTDVGSAVGLNDTRRTVGAVWFDFDEDGDLDLYDANMDGGANGLYRNDGGRFTDVARDAGLEWGGRMPREGINGTVRPCAADVNGDGHVDLFMANYGENGLFLNQGAGRFEDVSETWGINITARYDTCAFSDIDHDGRLDLYVNGTITGGISHRDYLFWNSGSKFEDITPVNIRDLEADHGVQWADFDRDGDEDLALTGMRQDAMHFVLRNATPGSASSRSLHVRVVDGNGMATRAGAEVRLYASGTGKLLGSRLVDTGSGYNSQNDMPVHFGLAEAGAVDVEVIYPGGGIRTAVTVRDVKPGDWLKRAVTVRIP